MKASSYFSFLKPLWANGHYIVLGLCIAFLFLTSQFSEDAQRAKEAAQAKTASIQAELKEAETAFRQTIEEKGSFEAYLRDHPREANLVGYGTLFLLVILLYGLWLDGWCLVKKIRGQPILKTLDFLERPRWTVGDIARFSVLFLALAIILGWAGEWLGHLWPAIFHENGRLILHGTLVDVSALLLILYFTHTKHHHHFFKEQIRRGSVWKDVGVGISVYLAVLPIVLALLLFLVWLVSLFHYEPPPQKIVEVFIEESTKKSPLMIYGVLLAAVVGPVIEEIFFRGFFYAALRKKYSAIPSALIVSIFFAFLHESAFAFLPIFLLSLLLTYAYEKRKSIIAPISLHVCHNVLFLSYFFLMKENFLDKFLH